MEQIVVDVMETVGFMALSYGVVCIVWRFLSSQTL